MKSDDFVQKISEQFEETDHKLFNLSTQFKKIPEWSSIIALSIIGMVDEIYNIRITGDDIRNCSTIEDLFNIVKSRA